MNIKEGQKARVWKCKKNDKRKNTYDVQMSTYEGKDKDDNARYSSWNASFVGDAYEKASELKEKDEIILLNAKIESVYLKEKKKEYTNLTVFDFDFE